MDITNKFACLGKAKGLSLGALLILSGCATSISGSIQTLGGKAINSREARINIVSLSDAAIQPQVLEVNPDGSFETTESVEKGQYMVEALVPGFKPMSIKLDLKKSEKILLKLTPAKQVKQRTYRMHDKLDESRGEGGATLVPPMNY